MLSEAIKAPAGHAHTPRKLSLQPSLAEITRTPRSGPGQVRETTVEEGPCPVIAPEGAVPEPQAHRSTPARLQPPPVDFWEFLEIHIHLGLL